MTRLVVSLSPHIQGRESAEKIMWSVVLALLPCFIAAAWFFGIRAVIVVITAVTTCVLWEFLIQKFLLKGEITISDGSAVITGMLLAFNLPAGIPLWQLAAGSAVAIGVAKMAFGGLGKNLFNPALAGRAFMLVSFPADMTTWPQPLAARTLLNIPDVLSAATPLGILKEGLKGGETAARISAKLPDYLDLFLGRTGGCIGEISVLAILIGGIFLLARRIITWHIPVFYILALFSFTGIFHLANPDKYIDPLFHILSGGAMLGAWFMATDMVTSPMTKKGQIIFALAGGILCGAIRLLGSYPEGCSYSILIMNAFVPLIDKYIKPKRFGQEAKYG